MNARTHVFELTVEGRQIEEVVLGIFHSVLLHRTHGKFQYKQEGSYSIATVGLHDIDCDFVEFTYVRSASDDLDQRLKKEVSSFRDMLRSPDGPHSGQISLEFHQKKRARWPFPAELIPWEVWTIKLDVITLANEHERQILNEKIGEMLAEKIIYIVDIMNRHEYVPKMPNQSELELIFDTSYFDIQPYLFKIGHQTMGPSAPSMGNTMRKLLKDTLSL